jgi:hypothetical protein
MNAAAESPAFRRLWLGQGISNLGTQVSLYALGLWLYQQHQQLSSFAAVAVVVQLAKILVMPVLGRFLARWSRREVMLCANAISSAATVLLAIHLLSGGRSSLLVFVCIAVAAAAEATLLLCFSSLIPFLVTREEWGKAGGLFASWDGAIVMAAPFLGALLAGTAGLVGVLALDASTSLVAALCTWLVFDSLRSNALDIGFVEPQVAAINSDDTITGGLREAIGQIWNTASLRPLLLLNIVVAGVFAAVEVAFPAWVVIAFGVWRLSTAMALGAVGYGLGFLIWRHGWASRSPRQWLVLLRRSLLLQGGALAGAGLMVFQADQGGLLVIWFAVVAAYVGVVPLVLSAFQGLWQQLVPIERQPLLFSGRYSMEWIARLVALLGISLLADRWIAPALQAGGWPEAVVEVLGSGPGRPTAVALGLMGWVMIVPLLGQWRALGQLANHLNEPCAS